ncbi:hypothetical protein BH160DRAFT_4521 [Burkholderia sp. H160]|nr:hypothetical protein BH160DRAFT_4521 [Burkholderia sp. H160]
MFDYITDKQPTSEQAPKVNAAFIYGLSGSC